MSGDLISLRMVVIASAQRDRDLLRQGAGLAAMPIDLDEHSAASAAGAIAKGGVDIVLFDGALPDNERATVISAAKAAKPAPIVIAIGPVGGARVDGLNAVVPKPADVDAARNVADMCVRLRMPTRVLIVDDSSTMRSIVRKILSASRFTLEVEETEEGIAALAQVRTGKFGIVFLDYNMPGLNGLETLSEIRRETPNVAVVMITSTLDDAIADRAKAAGALAFLKKPFYPADIDAVLEKYFGLK